MFAFSDHVSSGRGLTKFNQTVEFEEAPKDGIPDNGRRRVIITAVAPHQPESSHFFHFIYDLLQLPVDKAFHAFKGDFKAIAFTTGIHFGDGFAECLS